MENLSPEQTVNRSKFLIFVVVVLVLVFGALVWKFVPLFPSSQTKTEARMLAECNKDMGCYQQNIITIYHKDGLKAAVKVIEESKKDFPDLFYGCNYPLGHDLGSLAYKDAQNVTDVFKAAQICSAGFLRGFLAELLQSSPEKDLTKLQPKACEQLRDNEWFCFYRMGYLALMTATQLQPALNACNGLSTNEELRNACRLGVFHERAFFNGAILATSTAQEVTYPCDDIVSSFKEPCYGSIFRKFLFLPESDRAPFLQTSFETCAEVAEFDGTCRVGLGITASDYFAHTVDAISFCGTKGPTVEDRSECMRGALMWRTFINYFPEEICNKVPREFLFQCQQEIEALKK